MRSTGRLSSSQQSGPTHAVNYSVLLIIRSPVILLYTRFEKLMEKSSTGTTNRANNTVLSREIADTVNMLTTDVVAKSRVK